MHVCGSEEGPGREEGKDEGKEAKDGERKKKTTRRERERRPINKLTRIAAL